MRIAYMLTSLGIGGAERQVVALAERMASRGHTVVLVVLKPRALKEWPTNLQVIHLDMHEKLASVLGALMRGRRFLREFQPDLVHSHTYPANIAARMLKLLGAAPAVLSTIHNVYEGGSRRMLTYRLTDGLSIHTTAVCEAAADRFMRKKAVPQRKCTVMTNAIDTAEFAPRAIHRATSRAEQGVTGEFVWLAVGRMVPAKDYENLLRAFTSAPVAHHNTQLWIAAERTGQEFNRVHSLAAKLGVNKAIRWLGLRRDMSGLLDAADGFVLASAWEGMPLAIGEAMAMEKPVVATDVGGVREIVGEAGVLVPAKNAERLAEAMTAMMEESPESRRAMGHAARERILAGFSFDVRVNEWESLYRSLLVC
jgi:glycosyltransferase involved in cell wall biosynthesis